MMSLKHERCCSTERCFRRIVGATPSGPNLSPKNFKWLAVTRASMLVWAKETGPEDSHSEAVEAVEMTDLGARAALVSTGVPVGLIFIPERPMA
jgi:hypothetical protein